MKKPLVLCILDGCGIREDNDGNAFKNAKTPTYDYLWNNYPHSILQASGTYVGLPDGQMGNSEVGHTNIGAGRIVYQPLEMINHSIKDKSFFANEEIIKTIDHVKTSDSNLHIMGLLSDGGVHSHIDHLFALLEICKEHNLKNVYLDLFLDGRDTDPHSSIKYINLLEEKLKKLNLGTISTISGRYYAMDRDNNYDRVKLAYDAIVNGEGPTYKKSENLIRENWDKSITDEFIIPGLIEGSIPLKNDDGIITFNFRPDRLRELFTAITNPSSSPLETKELTNLKVVTMFPVTDSVKAPHAFSHQKLDLTLGEYLERNNLNQLRIAETEKYAHVTYFFDGGKEKDYGHMDKILIPSPKVSTYDHLPEMSASKITDTLIDKLDEEVYDVVILNYANGDMVGHTGNYESAVKAVEHLDTCLKRLYDKIEEKKGTLIITADHGNCDIMWDNFHNPVTSHTTNPVPFIITKKDLTLHDGVLADIAPTMIDLLGLIKPASMTGNCLIKK